MAYTGLASDGRSGYPSDGRSGYASDGQRGYASDGQRGYASDGQRGIPSDGQRGVPSDGYSSRYASNGYDYRYPSDGYDNRYPSDGYSRRYASDGYDNRYPSDGYDNRYPSDGYDRGYGYGRNYSDIFGGAAGSHYAYGYNQGGYNDNYYGGSYGSGYGYNNNGRYDTSDVIRSRPNYDRNDLNPYRFDTSDVIRSRPNYPSSDNDHNNDNHNGHGYPSRPNRPHDQDHGRDNDHHGGRDYASNDGRSVIDGRGVFNTSAGGPQTHAQKEVAVIHPAVSEKSVLRTTDIADNDNSAGRVQHAKNDTVQGDTVKLVQNANENHAVSTPHQQTGTHGHEPVVQTGAHTGGHTSTPSVVLISNWKLAVSTVAIANAAESHGHGGKTGLYGSADDWSGVHVYQKGAVSVDHHFFKNAGDISNILDYGHNNLDPLLAAFGVPIYRGGGEHGGAGRDGGAQGVFNPGSFAVVHSSDDTNYHDAA